MGSTPPQFLDHKCTMESQDGVKCQSANGRHKGCGKGRRLSVGPFANPLLSCLRRSSQVIAHAWKNEILCSFSAVRIGVIGGKSPLIFLACRLLVLVACFPPLILQFYVTMCVLSRFWDVRAPVRTSNRSADSHSHHSLPLAVPSHVHVCRTQLVWAWHVKAGGGGGGEGGEASPFESTPVSTPSVLSASHAPLFNVSCLILIIVAFAARLSPRLLPLRQYLPFPSLRIAVPQRTRMRCLRS